MKEFEIGDLVRIYYSVPSGLQNRILQIKNPTYGDDVKIVGHYIARVLNVKPHRLTVINTFNKIRHYVHPKQCRKVLPPAAKSGA
jgi:hypothetical protein